MTAMAATYTTATALRTDLGVNDTVLADAAATKLIEDAEDVIDRLLGAWPIDEDTGRKIVEDDVEAWQWTKLERATIKLAALLYTRPGLLTERQWTTISGPDFSFSGPQSAAVGAQVIALLDDSGLRRLTGRAAATNGRAMRPDYARFLNATRHNGT